MKISINVIPCKYTASTKDGVLRKGLGLTHTTFSTYGRYYTTTSRSDSSKNYAYVYTLEKHKQKFVHDVYKTGVNKGKTKKVVKVRDKQWIIHVYKFDIDILRLAGITLHQKTRTFVISGSKQPYLQFQT